MLKCFEEYHCFEKCQTGCQIISLPEHNEGDYSSSELAQYIVALGTTSSCICIYTTQQDSVEAQMNRVLLDMDSAKFHVQFVAKAF